MTTYREQLEVLDTLVLTRPSMRMDCPFCGGRNTFSLRRDFDKQFWKCFRASCGAKGTRRVDVTNAELRDRLAQKITVKKESFTPLATPQKPSDVPTVLLPGHKVKRSRDFLSQYGLSHLLTTYYAPKEDRIVFRHHEAYIGRALSTGPKWKKYGDYSQIWDYPHDTDYIIVVEDVISALRLDALGIHSIALCGTAMNHTINQEINLHYRNKNVYIALDADATRTGVQHSVSLGGAKVMPLKRDIKDMTDENIKDVIDGIL